jgi:hypothetical protein
MPTDDYALIGKMYDSEADRICRWMTAARKMLEGGTAIASLRRKIKSKICSSSIAEIPSRASFFVDE